MSYENSSFIVHRSSLKKLGCLGSNQGMPESKSGALPLGYSPKCVLQQENSATYFTNLLSSWQGKFYALASWGWEYSRHERYMELQSIGFECEQGHSDGFKNKGNLGNGHTNL